MISKIVLLFLAFIAVLGLFGKLRTAGRWVGIGDKKCSECGRYRIGKSPPPCDRQNCPLSKSS